MTTTDKLLLIASLATVLALLTRDNRVQLAAAVAGAAFALSNVRDALARG